jgi:legumain
MILTAFVSFVSADNWALLVAGSNGYYNYRHQADVCHSYQILRKNGFSDDRIVTMFYDDIARNPSNPVQDNLINEPDGDNVYTDCKKDYTGNLVTPENFLKVLAGEKMTVGSGKTLETGPQDNIFVFFSDHGATGILAFPSDELHALDLNNTITSMYNDKKYKQMLIYIEACEAGSMFNNILSPDVNVLAVTASDPDHSSYAIYYDATRGTYLGDVFSVYWMADSERNASSTKTVGDQYSVVRQRTDTSAVCLYGDNGITGDLLSQYQTGQRSSQAATSRQLPREVMDSRDINIAVLRHRLDAAAPAERPKISALLSAALMRREQSDARIRGIARFAATLKQVDILAAPLKSGDDICYPRAQTVEDAACLKEMIHAFKSVCGAFDDYSLKHVRALNNLCNAGLSAEQMLGGMQQACL